MRQFLKSGSVRGVRSNPHPYRDPSLWRDHRATSYGNFFAPGPYQTP